jgi:hypothetical protein
MSDALVDIPDCCDRQYDRRSIIRGTITILLVRERQSNRERRALARCAKTKAPSASNKAVATAAVTSRFNFRLIVVRLLRCMAVLPWDWGNEYV